MRITITYFEGYPELEAELAKHSSRARAERLRFLAAMGLAFMQDGRSHLSAANGVPVPTVTPAAPAASQIDEAGAAGEAAARAITKDVFKQAN